MKAEIAHTAEKGITTINDGRLVLPLDFASEIEGPQIDYNIATICNRMGLEMTIGKRIVLLSTTRTRQLTDRGVPEPEIVSLADEQMKEVADMDFIFSNLIRPGWNCYVMSGLELDCTRELESASQKMFKAFKIKPHSGDIRPRVRLAHHPMQNQQTTHQAVQEIESMWPRLEGAVLLAQKSGSDI